MILVAHFQIPLLPKKKQSWLTCMQVVLAKHLVHAIKSKLVLAKLVAQSYKQISNALLW